MSCTSAATSPVSAACFACLVGNAAAPSWGALVLYGDNWELNQGGCYAAESASALACAEATQFQQECENAVCASDANGSGGGASSLDVCVGYADEKQCSCYVTNAAGACALETSSACTFAEATSFDTRFAAIAKVMCE